MFIWRCIERCCKTKKHKRYVKKFLLSASGPATSNYQDRLLSPRYQGREIKVKEEEAEEDLTYEWTKDASLGGQKAAFTSKI